MAGLINSAAMGQQTQGRSAQDAMGPANSRPMAQEPAMRVGAPEMAQEDTGEVDENNPAFVTAVDFAMKALYENEAAKDVARQLRAASDPAEGIADVAYNITATVDERTEGEVPDELLGLLGMTILQEVAEIADAAGVDTSDETVSNAFKIMILRYLRENGVETNQLQQAMDSIDPSAIEEAKLDIESGATR